MDFLIALLKNIGPFVAAFAGLCSALIAVFLLIPGPQPEGFLQKVVDFLAKFSVK